MEFKEIARIIAISVAILFIGATASGQECVHSNGFLTELSPGTTYTMKPLIDEGYITPVKTGMETGLPCIFTFSVPKKSYVRIRFELPDKLSSKKYGSLACAFSTSSLYWVEQKKFLNPALIQSLYSGTDTAITLQLGITIAYPEGVYNARYFSMVKITATEKNNKFVVRDSALYSIEKVFGDMWSTPVLQIDNALAGSTYTLFVSRDGTTSLNPVISGIESAVAMEYLIEGDELAPVMFDLELPKILVNEKGDSIHCSFSGTSMLCDDYTGKRLLNPLVSNLGRLDVEGQIRFRIGITVVIPESASPGLYMGQSLMNLCYTGLKNGNEGIVFGSSAVGEFYVNVVPKVIPYYFELSQNYPNPFNPVTTIRYVLAEETHVTMTIFDVLGREIEQIVNEVQPRGIHSTLWDANSRENGVYFYRINTEHYTETKKLILLR